MNKANYNTTSLRLHIYDNDLIKDENNYMLVRLPADASITQSKIATIVFLNTIQEEFNCFLPRCSTKFKKF